ncbi:Eukaryotic translation initiation factor 4 gamma 1, partial [Kappamyces sp. JEL0680]
MQVDGVIKYSMDFLIAIGKIITAKPQVMMAWKDIYGDARPPQPPRMNRQPSERGSRGRGGSIRGRGSMGESRGMSRQQSGSSSRGHLPGRKGGKHQPILPALVKGENAWGAKKLELSESETCLKTVKGLLNKMTLDNFEKLTNKILECNIGDEDTLAGVIALICEKAIDEPHFASIYAMLCSSLFFGLPKIQEWVCPTGAPQDNLFRKFLLKRCQEEFEKDAKWAADDATAQAARAELRKRIDELSPEEKLKIAEEDYERNKLKRRVLGNIRFVGELFLQGMIAEAIIHRCILSLLKNMESPEEEDIESLCKLLTATGKKLDHDRAKPTMDAYFNRMEILSVSEGLLS